MALVPWQHGSRGAAPFRDLREHVERLFEDVFRGRGQPPPWAGRGVVATALGFTPRVNLKDTDGAYTVTAEVPGLEKQELEVSITEGTVTLKGERRRVKESAEERVHCQETAFGAFERVIALPGGIQPEGVEAKLKDGVLTLTLPKAETAKRKPVRVHAR